MNDTTVELSHKLILSIFPGIDLLGMAFEYAGFCVVRGPDLLWGGDIRNFSPPPGVFWGIIGGPPCQDFSRARRDEPTGYGLEMLEQYARVVIEAQPEWWMMENVDRVPSVTTLQGHIFAELNHSYAIQRMDIDQKWFCDVTRLRHIQFGSQSGRLLNVTRRRVTNGHACDHAALASDSRPFPDLCRLQGLHDDFDLPPFLMEAKKRAVGNGVPLPMGRALAQAVLDAYNGPVVVQCDFAGKVTPARSCGCGCGRQVTGKSKYYDYSCRKRAQRKRDASRGHSVTNRPVTEGQV